MEPPPQVTPESILSREFSVGVRGYLRGEVDAFLRLVAFELEVRDERIMILQEELRGREQELMDLKRQLGDSQERIGVLVSILMTDWEELDARMEALEKEVSNFRQLTRSWMLQALGRGRVAVGTGLVAARVDPPRRQGEAFGNAYSRVGFEGLDYDAAEGCGMERVADRRSRVVRVVNEILGRTNRYSEASENVGRGATVPGP